SYQSDATCYIPKHALLLSPTRRSSDLPTRGNPRQPAALQRFVALDMAGNVCDDRGMTDQNTAPIIYHVFCHTPWGPKCAGRMTLDRKSTRLNSSHVKISYAVVCLKKKR